jgi:hypothetical protein
MLINIPVGFMTLGHIHFELCVTQNENGRTEGWTDRQW